MKDVNKLTLLARVKKARIDFIEIFKNSNSLNDNAAEMASVKELRDYIKEVDDELKSFWKDLVKKSIELMDVENIDNFTTKDGIKISRDFQVRGKIQNSVEFFMWLSEKGDQELGKMQLAPSIIPDNIKEIIQNTDPNNVKLVVHWKKLASYCKDVCDVLDAKTWPGGVTIEAWPDIKLKLKGD